MKHFTLSLLISLLVACSGSSTDEPTEPTQPVIITPKHPAAGTILEESCDGTTLVRTLADGGGGSTQETIPESEACGYEAPPQFGTPLSDPYCANGATDMFLRLLAIIQNLDEYDKVQDFADGEGGSYQEVVENESEDCGYVPVPDAGTKVGESYCAGSLTPDAYEPHFESINHLLPEDRLQDYADGEGGTYTERTVHLDQSCFVQMEKPEDCPTVATSTGDSRYGYMTCDGIKQNSSVSFPYQPVEEHVGRAIIDMLVVFDSNMTEEERDGMTVEEFVNRQFYEANHVFMMSGAYVLLRVADIVMVDVSEGDLYRQYQAFFQGKYEFTDIDVWQREANADLAFLFKKRHNDPVACGVASLDATRGLENSRGITQCFHNSVFQEYETTRYYERAHETFVHEVGHLLGLAHAWEDAGTSGIFEYSFGYNIPGYNPQTNNPDYKGTYGGYGTIMSYADLPTGRFSDRSEYCEIPETGEEVRLGTDGGCFCLDNVEDQPPPTDSVESLQRVRWQMSQLNESHSEIQASSRIGREVEPVWSIWTNLPKDICMF